MASPCDCSRSKNRLQPVIVECNVVSASGGSMRITHIETLISKGVYANSKRWLDIRGTLLDDIKTVEWPAGTGKFVIYPESGKKRGCGNGVTPIKNGLIERLKSAGWKPEAPLRIASKKRPGKVDAILYSKDGAIALEWETGNISSSHRALNKMCLGLMKGALIAGVLVVPSRSLYRYLTDRVGNWDELEPYVDVWKKILCDRGVLEIVVIEHDSTSLNVPKIPKGTDGRALS